MRRLLRIAPVLASCWALAGLGTAPARAEVLVTVFAGNPGGAGSLATPNLDFSGLQQLGSFAYYGLSFNTESRDGNAGNGNWAPLYRNDNYAVRITGQFQVAQTGFYTFSTSSDDGSVLRIDNQLVVNNNLFQGVTTRTGTALLQAGIHNFEVQFYQGGGGKSLDVGSLLGINQLPAGVTIVNHDNFPQLQVNVYADTPAARRYNIDTGEIINPNNPLLGTIIAPDINFDYATGSHWAPFGRGDDYSVSITGQLLVGADGTYNFGLNSDDGSWLFIDGNQVVNNGGIHSLGSNQTAPFGLPQQQGSVFLTAGLHDFEVRMFEAGGGQGLTLYLPQGVGYATPEQLAAPIPEPSSLALAGLGLAAGVVGLRWRRRREA